VQQGRHGRQVATGVDARLRCNVGAIQHHLLVAAALQYARHAERGISVAQLACRHQAQAQRAGLDRLRLVAGIGQIAQGMVGHAIAQQLVADLAAAFAVEGHLVHALPGQRRRQADGLAREVGRHVQRRWRGVVLRDQEGRAIRQHAAGAQHAQAPGR